MPPKPKRIATSEEAASAKKPRAAGDCVAPLFQGRFIRTIVDEYVAKTCKTLKPGFSAVRQSFLDSSEFDASAPFFGAWPSVTSDRGVVIGADMLPYNMDVIASLEVSIQTYTPSLLYLMPAVVEREDYFYHFLVPMVRPAYNVFNDDQQLVIEPRNLTRDRLYLVPNVHSCPQETFIYAASAFDSTAYVRLAAEYSKQTNAYYNNPKMPNECDHLLLLKQEKKLFFATGLAFVEDCALFQKTVWNAFAMQYDLPKVYDVGPFRDSNAIIGEWLNFPATHPFLSVPDPTLAPPVVLAELSKKRAELAAATASVNAKNADLAAAMTELDAVKARLAAADAELAAKDAEIARLKSAKKHQKTVQSAKQTVQSTDLGDRVAVLEEEVEFFRSIAVSVADDASLDNRVQTLKALGQRVFQGLKLEHAQEYMAMFEETDSGCKQRYMNFRKWKPDDVFDAYYEEWRPLEQRLIISPYDELRKKLEIMAVSWDKDRIMVEFKFVFAQMIEAIAASHMYGHMYTETLQKQEQQLWRDAEQFTTLRDDVMQGNTSLMAMEGFRKTMSHLGGSISKEVVFEDKWGMFNVGNVIIDVLEDALKYATRPGATSETVFEALMLGEGDTKICLSAMTARRFQSQSSILNMFRQLCVNTHMVDQTFLSGSTHRMPLPQQNMISALHRALVASLGRPFLLSDPSSPDSKVNIELLHQQFGLAEKLVADKTVVS